MGVFDLEPGWAPTASIPEREHHPSMVPMRQDFTAVVMISYPGDEENPDGYDVPYTQQVTAESAKDAILALVARNEEAAGPGSECTLIALFCGNHFNLVGESADETDAREQAAG